MRLPRLREGKSRAHSHSDTQQQSWGLNPGPRAPTAPSQPRGTEHEYFPYLCSRPQVSLGGLDRTSNAPPPGEVEGAARLWAPHPELAASLHLPNPGCGLPMALLVEGTQGSSERWWIPGLGKEKYKMSPEHFVLPESQEVIKDDAGWVTRLSIQLEGAPSGWR